MSFLGGGEDVFAAYRRESITVGGAASQLQPEGDSLGVSFAEDLVKPTVASKCYVDPVSVAAATVRKLNMFVIEARLGDGTRQPNGGDSFFVAIRGRGETVRAKVIDQENGQYAVGFKPVNSGKYTISISLLGEPLPGSPFMCMVGTPTASAPHCLLKGAALRTAIARKEEMFEVQFRDQQGQTAHAEDLNVYVRRVTQEELEEWERIAAEEGFYGDDDDKATGYRHAMAERDSRPIWAGTTSIAWNGAVLSWRSWRLKPSTWRRASPSMMGGGRAPSFRRS